MKITMFDEVSDADWEELQRLTRDSRRRKAEISGRIEDFQFFLSNLCSPTPPGAPSKYSLLAAAMCHMEAVELDFPHIELE